MGTTTEELKKLYNKLGGGDPNIPKASTPGEVLNGINELDLGGGSSDVVASKSITGNPIEFDDGADTPLIKCTVNIQGYQEGSGDPSPVNVRKIHAYDKTVLTFKDNAVPANTKSYTVEHGMPDVYSGIFNFVNKTLEFDVGAINLGSDSGWNKTTEDDHTIFFAYFPKTIKLSTKDYFCSHYVPTTGEKLGNNEIKISVFPNDMYDVIAIRDDSKANISYEEFGRAMYSVTLVYKTLEKIVRNNMSVTNYPVKSLSGYNHIECNSGEMDIEYFVKGEQAVIDLIDKKGGAKIDDELTSANTTWSSTKINSEISSHIGTEYSTSEKSIGKWTDGRTVYRKIIPIDSTWLNIGTVSNQSIVYQEDWVKSIDFITNATAVSSEEYYASKFDLAAQVDRGYGTITGYWNNPFADSLDRIYVSYVILEYVKASS